MKKLQLIVLLNFWIFILGQTPEEISKEFFQKYETNSDEAVDYLFASNEIFSSQITELNNLKAKIKESRSALGTFLGYEKFSEKSINQTLVELKYIGKFQGQPLRFIFHYYKPKDKWIILNFNFDDAILEEFTD